MSKMIRPKWEDVYKPDDYVYCNCGNNIGHQGLLREHWQNGHFDYPEDPAGMLTQEETLACIMAAILASTSPVASINTHATDAWAMLKHVRRVGKE